LDGLVRGAFRLRSEREFFVVFWLDKFRLGNWKPSMAARVVL